MTWKETATWGAYLFAVILGVLIVLAIAKAFGMISGLVQAAMVGAIVLVSMTRGRGGPQPPIGPVS